MAGFLKRLNRSRLYARAARRDQARADAALAEMDADNTEAVRRLMRRFRPVDPGIGMIRLGPEGDGGYILPDDLNGIGALYSPGVSDTTGFDHEMAERGIACHLADGTVERPGNLHATMTFEKIMVAGTSTPGFTSMADWIARRGPETGDLMLQMDIEGAEYEVIPAMPRELLRRFRIMVFEIHDVAGKLTRDRAPLRAFLDALEPDHVLVHLHPNNAAPAVRLLGHVVPQLIELTFLRRDRASPGETAPIPHPLDRRNVGAHADLPADPFWSV